MTPGDDLDEVAHAGGYRRRLAFRRAFYIDQGQHPPLAGLSDAFCIIYRRGARFYVLEGET